MPAPADFETLELLFRRTGSLPALPRTAVQLVKSIDSGSASAGDLERIIAADPSLTAEFLRMASLAGSGGVPRFSSIRGAIMLLGQRTVRSLAMSLLLRQLTFARAKTPWFNTERFSRHSLAVAVLSRFLFARKQMAGEMTSGWSVDEVFAIGLLSSLGIGLLAQVSIDSFDRVFYTAKRSGVTLEEGFQKVFGKPSTLLTVAAVEVWGLPSMFSEALIHFETPWSYAEEFAALCCLCYAVALSDSFDLSIGDWKSPVSLEPEIEVQVGLSDPEQKTLMETVTKHVDEWIKSSGKAA